MIYSDMHGEYNEGIVVCGVLTCASILNCGVVLDYYFRCCTLEVNCASRGTAYKYDDI